jgi:hypothetical protein
MSGNGKANGNGTRKKAWNLAKDGMLWKRVLDYSTKEFQKKAEAFVAQLQEAVQPADALQGLLLDRMAAAYLRKHLMLEAEAATREYNRYIWERELSGKPEGKVRAIAASLSSESTNILRYEALLDQGFHRDMILLQKLKELAPVPDTEPGKLPKSDRGLIEGGSIV